MNQLIIGSKQKKKKNVVVFGAHLPISRPSAASIPSQLTAVTGFLRFPRILTLVRHRNWSIIDREVEQKGLEVSKME